MTIRSYRDLDVWKPGMTLAAATCRTTAGFPASERYGLSSQLQRCAVSIPSNIAEGHQRDSTKDFLRFLAMAQGSLAELGRMLNGLQSKLRARLSPSSPASGP